MRNVLLFAVVMPVLSALAPFTAEAAGAKDCELFLAERPRARMMRRPAVELRTFNSLPRVADAAAAVLYAPEGASGDALEALDRIALDTALERLDSPRRMIIDICHGDPETNKTAPALGSCMAHYYRTPDGSWERLPGKLGASLAQLVDASADAPARSHYQLMQAIVACGNNQTDEAIALFQSVAGASGDSDARSARAVGIHALVESAMLQKRQIVGTRRKLGRKQMERLTAMLGEHSRKRCEIMVQGEPFQVYGGNEISVGVARGYNKSGYVQLSFDLDEHGVPADITIVDQQPSSGLYGKASTSTLSSARYMAACQDGKPHRVSGYQERMNWGVTQTGSPEVLFSP